MKLIKLEILNLASLDKQGGEVINFVEGALGDSTIFSIVGPTGSGKSTILDAICLALYNRAPRYPRKKGDRNQGIEIYGEPDEKEACRLAPTDSRNILTRGKKEGYSKLTFLANNGYVYRAEWHVVFKTKKYGDAVTVLYKIGYYEDGTPKEELAEWKDLPLIIGLDYDQFLRTVLIAQGSFANFLTAKENERYELLEKLIGCEETYSRIANEIKARKDAAVENFNMVNASVDAVKQNLLSDEDLNRLDEEISQLQKVEEQLAVAKTKVEKQLQWYDEDERMVADVNQQQTSEERAKQELEAFRPSIQRLNLHDAITPALDCFREIKKTDAVVEGLIKNIGEYEIKTQKQEDLITAANANLNQLKEAVVEAQKVIDETTPHVKTARELQTKMDGAKTTLTDKQKTKATAEKEKNEAEKAVTDNKSDIEKAKGKADKAAEEYQETQTTVEKKKAELNEASANAEEMLLTEKRKVEGMNAEELQSEKSSADTAWQNVKDALEVVGHLDKATEEKAAKETQRKELEGTNSILLEKLASLTIDALKNEIETLRNTYTLMTSEKWELHRNSLEEGKPCPLCGATIHPYKVDDARFEETTSELSTLLKNKELSLQNQQKDEKTWSGEIKTNEGKILGITQRLQQLQVEIEDYESEWRRLLELDPQLKRDKGELEIVLSSCKKKKEEADEKLSFFIKVQKNIDTLVKQKDKAVKEQTKYAEVANDLLAKAQQKVIADNTKLAELKALTPTLIQQQDEKRKSWNDALMVLQQACDVVNELQKAYNNELGGESPDVVEQRLKKKKEEADAAVVMKNEELSKMKTSLGEIKGALQTKKSSLEEEKQNRIKKQSELGEWLVEYNGKDDRIQDVSLEDVEAMYHATEDWNVIRQEKEHRTKAVVSSSALLNKAKDTHAKHQTTKPEKERDALIAELQELQNNSRNDELVAAKARKKNHEDAIILLGDKVDELKKVTKVKDDWTAITDAIGGDGKTLRKIAQCYTLSFLIEHANVEIRKFNSRYELQQVKHSLGIRVIDHDRADDVRDTTSLSGGETFIVSLGLALGLSALSSRNISFENLFIDEGFGTLDPETLTVVINSLAMLQSSQGKKVGVISHTDVMSEKITTQIRIIKNGNSGSSHIEIYP